MRIVTGYTGSPHITSNADQGRNQGIFGTGSCVLNVGNKFEPTLDSVTQVSIKDGEGILQGVHFRVDPGTVDTVSIQSGTTGYNRIDLICARYTKDVDTGFEKVEWAVIQGTPSQSTPSEPSYTVGDILAGDLLAELPLFRVTFTGLTPVLADLTSSVGYIRPLSFLSSMPKAVAAGVQDVEVTGSSSADVTKSAFTIEEGTYLVPIRFEVSAAETGTSSKSTSVEWWLYSGETGTNHVSRGEFTVYWNGNSNDFSHYDNKVILLNVLAETKYRLRLKVNGTGLVDAAIYLGAFYKIMQRSW